MTIARFTVGISCALLLLPGSVFAAELRLGQPVVVVREGDEVAVPVSLDPGSDVLNAFEGSLRFSPNIVLRAVRFTGSLVPLWVAEPQERSAGVVSFTGLFPGGYQEQYSNASAEGNLFTLIFEAKRIGEASIFTGPDTAAYANDGAGTRVQLSTASLSFAVVPSSRTSRKVEMNDVIPPEPFQPVIVWGEPYGIEGPVVIFNTQDKGSGIARYEVARSYGSNSESDRLSWEKAESPYRLSADDVDKFVFVRAVDNAGNTRVGTVPPQSITVQSLLYRFGFLLALLCIAVVILCYRVLRARRQAQSGILHNDAAGS